MPRMMRSPRPQFQRQEDRRPRWQDYFAQFMQPVVSGIMSPLSRGLGEFIGERVYEKSGRGQAELGESAARKQRFEQETRFGAERERRTGEEWVQGMRERQDAAARAQEEFERRMAGRPGEIQREEEAHRARMRQAAEAAARTGRHVVPRGGRVWPAEKRPPSRPRGPGAGGLRPGSKGFKHMMDAALKRQAEAYKPIEDLLGEAGRERISLQNQLRGTAETKHGRTVTRMPTPQDVQRINARLEVLNRQMAKRAEDDPTYARAFERYQEASADVDYLFNQAAGIPRQPRATGGTAPPGGAGTGAPRPAPGPAQEPAPAPTTPGVPTAMGRGAEAAQRLVGGLREPTGEMPEPSPLPGPGRARRPRPTPAAEPDFSANLSPEMLREARKMVSLARRRKTFDAAQEMALADPNTAIAALQKMNPAQRKEIYANVPADVRDRWIQRLKAAGRGGLAGPGRRGRRRGRR